MSSFQFPDPPTDLDFPQFFKHCLEVGIRPPGENPGTPWAPKDFAKEANISYKQVTNYLAGKSAPLFPPLGIENVWFGKEQSYLPNWRRELRGALRRTRETKATSSRRTSQSGQATPPRLDTPAETQPASLSLLVGSPSVTMRQGGGSVRPALNGRHLVPTLRENGPRLVGSIGIAQGLVHIVWILSLFIREDATHLCQSPWTYADVVFGFGGVILGLGCIRIRDWARDGGICFCLLSLLCSYLWFMDESNNGPDRVVFAINLLSPPFSLGALCYFLFAWPNRGHELPVGAYR